MISRALVPSGSLISPMRVLAALTSSGGSPDFQGDCYTSSGSAALALAVASALRVTAGRRTVVIPGYCCPDVATSVLKGGGRPRAVDLRPDSLFPSADEYHRAVRSDCAAIVSVSAFGIRDPRLAELSDLSRAAGALLILDDAQTCPTLPCPHADLQVHSFGRGKPVAVGSAGHLSWTPSLDPIVRDVIEAAAVTSGEVRSCGELLLRNIALAIASRSLVLRMLRRIPSMRIGETYRRDPTAPLVLPRRAAGALRTVISNAHCISSSARHYLSLDWAALGLRIAPDARAEIETLWRLPVLASSAEHRAAILSDERLRDLGVTGCYGRSINKFLGAHEIEGTCAPDRLQNSCKLATHLVTLPTHRLATPQVISEIDRGLLRAYAAASRSR
jgi:hypothetical protein